MAPCTAPVAPVRCDTASTNEKHPNPIKSNPGTIAAIFLSFSMPYWYVYLGSKLNKFTQNIKK
jgi:hypothetical protein